MAKKKKVNLKKNPKKTKDNVKIKEDIKEIVNKPKRSFKKILSLRERAIIAWRSLTFFLMLFVVSFILYHLSLNELLRNFFGIISVIFGFLVLTFLMAFIVLVILRSDSKKKNLKV